MCPPGPACTKWSALGALRISELGFLHASELGQIYYQAAAVIASNLQLSSGLSICLRFPWLIHAACFSTRADSRTTLPLDAQGVPRPWSALGARRSLESGFQPGLSHQARRATFSTHLSLMCRVNGGVSTWSCPRKVVCPRRAAHLRAWVSWDKYAQTQALLCPSPRKVFPGRGLPSARGAV